MWFVSSFSPQRAHLHVVWPRCCLIRIRRGIANFQIALKNLEGVSSQNLRYRENTDNQVFSPHADHLFELLERVPERTWPMGVDPHILSSKIFPWMIFGHKPCSRLYSLQSYFAVRQMFISLVSRIPRPPKALGR
jgi:hypothetical protein